MIPTFVFDKTDYLVPDQWSVTDPFYYQSIQYKPNIASGMPAEFGIMGHGSIFTDIMYSDIPYNTIYSKNITDETDLIYLIEPWPLFNGLKEKYGDEIVMPLNWHLILRHIDERILELARDKRLIIVLHIPEYTSGIHAVDYRLQISRKALGIPDSQFKFISGNRTPEWYYWTGFEYSQFLCYNRVPKVTDVNLKQRQKKFTCLNRIDKMHRRYIAYNIWKNGLDTNGYFSYSFARFTSSGLHRANPESEVPFLNGDWDMSLQDWKEFYYAGPYMADHLSLVEHNDHWYAHKEHYNEAYWNFVTETSIDDAPCLTEKTFKPIANLQPFVILGSPGTLETLQDLGYKTFNGIIDETYDKVMNHESRIKLATDQSMKLANMSHQEHIKIMHQIKPILEHNQNHFFSSKGRITEFVKYIKGQDPKYNWLKDCKYD